MKAIIFNSGIGKRMGELTKNSPKAMVKLLNGETIFERQIRILSECGIKDFIITTGPFADQLMEITKKDCYNNLHFEFIHNDIYNTTNYIYSFYLARHFLNDNFLSLHGDLVFSKNLVLALLNDQRESIGLINPNLSLPAKDFKARVKDGKIVEVSINIFDKDCFTFQPLYKLSKKDINLWMHKVIDFIENKKIDTVYAENAFNEISNSLNVQIMDYSDYYINEIDNLEDLKKVSEDIRLRDYQDQEIYYGLSELPNVILKYQLHKPLVITNDFLLPHPVMKILEKYANVVIFTKLSPNPKYEEVIEAISYFKDSNCDSLISIGGGSVIDVAKAVKLFLPLDENNDYLKQEHKFINLKHISIPTTAGTGSESTRYAVIYKDGIKQSLTNDFLLPDVAILEPDFLKTLPLNQKKATIMDALCHSIESLWSINSLDISRDYAKKSIKSILKYMDDYLNDDFEHNFDLLLAANYAGKAINLTATTAAHALSYKITSLYNIPHGQAVALVLPYVWKILNDKKLSTFDPRGVEHVDRVLTELNVLFNATSTLEAIKKFIAMLNYHKINLKLDISTEQLNELCSSVNLIRLKNFPIHLTYEDILSIYLKLKK